MVKSQDKDFEEESEILVLQNLFKKLSKTNDKSKYARVEHYVGEIFGIFQKQKKTDKLADAWDLQNQKALEHIEEIPVTNFKEDIANSSQKDCN